MLILKSDRLLRYLRTARVLNYLRLSGTADREISAFEPGLGIAMPLVTNAPGAQKIRMSVGLP